MKRTPIVYPAGQPIPAFAILEYPILVSRMCSHYQAVKEAARLQRYFAVSLPVTGELAMKTDMWPGYLGSFIRSHPNADVGDEAVPSAEHLPGLFGLVPHWADSTKLSKSTFNARSETAAEKPSFRDAWKRAQHCIIPAEAIYEPDWRSGKAIPTRISMTDGSPLGIAGLWSSWKSDKAEIVHSFTMLTINATAHPLMQNFHKPADEKRMVVILPPERYQDWLVAKAEDSMDFMVPFAANSLRSAAVVPERGGLFA
jgi:putative SOS response-associated peptidase YedK